MVRGVGSVAPANAESKCACRPPAVFRRVEPVGLGQRPQEVIDLGKDAMLVGLDQMLAQPRHLHQVWREMHGENQRWWLFPAHPDLPTVGQHLVKFGPPAAVAGRRGGWSGRRRGGRRVKGSTSREIRNAAFMTILSPMAWGPACRSRSRSDGTSVFKTKQTGALDV